MTQRIVVDGANVAYEEKTAEGKPKLRNLLLLRDCLRSKGYEPIIIVDASLRYAIDDRKGFECLESEQIIRQSPAGTQADYFVIKTAEAENTRIISNDQYEVYQHEFPWVRERRVPFMIVDGNIELYENALKKGN